MDHTVDLFTALFYSTEMWGLFGPLLFVVAGYFITKENKHLGLIWFVVILILVGVWYLPNIVTYYYQVFILLFGGIVTCLVPQLK